MGYIPAGGSGGGGGTPFLTKQEVAFADSPISAVAGNHYSIDTTSGAVAINLPAGASGGYIAFSDAANNFATNAVTITPNGAETISGQPSLILDSDKANVTIYWSTSTSQWAFLAAESFVDAGGGISNPVGLLYSSIQTVTFNDQGTSTLDAATHNVFSLTMATTGNSSIAISNLPASGNEYFFRLHFSWSGTGALTWFSGSTLKGDAVPSATGSYIVNGVTIDGGSTITLMIIPNV